MGDNYRRLHDHALRVIGPRGDSDLMDPASRGGNRGGQSGISFVEDRIGHSSVSREKAGVTNVDNLGTYDQLSLEQHRQYHRRHRPLRHLRSGAPPTYN